MSRVTEPAIDQHRRSLDPRRPLRVFCEHEDQAGGRGVADVLTVILTASRCTINCQMCDLWQDTLMGSTPNGAIATQIELALATPAWVSLRQSAPPGRPAWLKLYNSGNFFDPRSIPVDDYPAIIRLCGEFQRVIVENHPLVGGQRLTQFHDLLKNHRGDQSPRLEVAVGLETVQPGWLRRIDKRMSRDDFDQYARRLRQADVDLRVFLIVGVPGGTVGEALRWATVSVHHAVRCGARHISLIPARTGNGWGVNLNQSPLPPVPSSDLQRLRDALVDRFGDRCMITIDSWGET